MGVDLEEYFKINRPEQCIEGTKWLLDKIKSITPKVYMEIGCAHLSTFRLYEGMLPKSPDGLAIGLDIRVYKEWEGYSSLSGCDVSLIAEDSTSNEAVLHVRETLGKRDIDYLFIDGNHNIEYVSKDWTNYGSLVRSGGLVAVHDVDLKSLDRGETTGNGGALITKEAINDGLRVEFPPITSIGTSLIYIP